MGNIVENLRFLGFILYELPHYLVDSQMVPAYK